MNGLVGLRKKMWTHNDGVKKVRQDLTDMQTVVKIRPVNVSDREQNPCDKSTDNEKGLQEKKMEKERSSRCDKQPECWRVFMWS